MLLGDLNKVAYLMQAFDRATPLPEERVSLLFDIGAPSPRRPPCWRCPDDAPKSAIVTACQQRRRSASAFPGGKRSLKMVMEATRAGTGCGSCKKLVRGSSRMGLPRAMSRKTPVSIIMLPACHYSKPDLIEPLMALGKTLRAVSCVY